MNKRLPMITTMVVLMLTIKKRIHQGHLPPGYKTCTCICSMRTHNMSGLTDQRTIDLAEETGQMSNLNMHSKIQWRMEQGGGGKLGSYKLDPFLRYYFRDKFREDLDVIRCASARERVSGGICPSFNEKSLLFCLIQVCSPL